MTGCHSGMSHDGSYDEYGKVVHRPCSSCISSIENVRAHSEAHQNTLQYSKGGILSQSDG